MERDHIGLIASDMDYTLLDENGRLPQDFARLVLELEQEGVYFAAASGRPLYTLEDMFPDLRGHIALIGDNGGVIRWRGRDIFQSRMPGADYREMAAATREAGDIGVLCGLDTAYVERQYQQYARVFSPILYPCGLCGRPDRPGCARRQIHHLPAQGGLPGSVRQALRQAVRTEVLGGGGRPQLGGHHEPGRG